MNTSASTLRYAIVTGGASGLGREFCLRLARNGWQIAIADVDRAGAEETSRLVAQAGGVGRVEHCGVTPIEAWLALRERLQADWPRLDLLVNDAGMYASGYVGSLDLPEAERLVRLNLFSVLYGSHTMVPWMCDGDSPLILSASDAPRGVQKQEKGTVSLGPRAIINVASSFAFICPPGMAPYNLSKAAVVALSETLHSELKPRGVGVTVVCPGPMPTRFIENASFDSSTFRRLTETYVRDSTLDPAAVAAAALLAAERKQLYVVMGGDQHWYWRIKRLMPVTLLNRVAHRVRKDLASIAKEQRTRDN